MVKLLKTAGWSSGLQSQL